MMDKDRPKPAGKKTREERLAAQLRENLKKRKQQARERTAGEAATSSEPPPDRDA